ncbi:hypothetical protein ACMXYX_17760 (plasmid) [Neptuniibacter sp. QD72_48]|uniref:hypothetical protein n=1 Tax=Neptuniibacter sp. QD72_48 TaxID=3398214 RepID=UPI0039F58AD5
MNKYNVDNFNFGFEPNNNHGVFYTNGIGEFALGGYEYASLVVKPFAGDQVAEDMMTATHHEAFAKVMAVLNQIAQKEPELLHKNAGQFWWDLEDRLKIRRLDEAGPEVVIGEGGHYTIEQFTPEVH